jgi:hypothetical protein
VAIAADAGIVERLQPHRAWLADELLATALEIGPSAEIADADADAAVDLDGARLHLSVARA